MIFQRLIATVFCVLISSVAIAEDHKLSEIKGDKIELKTYDHAIAGSIQDFVVWGFVNEQTGASQLLMRRDGQVIETSFSKQGDKMGGVIEHTVANKKITTELFFVSLDTNSNEYTFEMNGQPFTVKVTADDFQNHHFINPTYAATLPDGSEFNFRLEGQACYNYSMHLIFMIVGAYSH